MTTRSDIEGRIFSKSVGSQGRIKVPWSKYGCCYDCHRGTDLKGEVKIDLRGTGLVISKVSVNWTDRYRPAAHGQTRNSGRAALRQANVRQTGPVRLVQSGQARWESYPPEIRRLTTSVVSTILNNKLHVYIHNFTEITRLNWCLLQKSWIKHRQDR
jgi:hypothetical protein